MKRNHPEYRPVVFMDTTTGYKFLAVQQNASSETVEFEGEIHSLIRVKFHQTHTHSTLDVSTKQMDVDRFNKNIVSNNQLHHSYTLKHKNDFDSELFLFLYLFKL